MATVKIPGIGPVEKKWVYIGSAFVVGIVGYAYWNKSRADAAESEVSDFTEGPGYAMDSGVDEYVNPGGSQPPVEQDYNAAPSNNIEWGQAAIEFLNDQGFEGGAIAVGRYLTRQTLSSTQANMIRAVHGAIGPPPQGDFPITITPTTPTPETPDYKPGKSLAQVTGLRQNGGGPDSIWLTWNPVPGAVGYYMYKTGQAAPIGYSDDTTGKIGRLKKGTYWLYVRGMGPDDKVGPKSSSIRASTK